MKKIFSLTLIASVVIGVFGLTTASLAANYVVNVTDANAASLGLTGADHDETDSAVTCTEGGSSGNKCTLRKAIVQANALSENVTITLPSGTITLSQSGSEDVAAAGDLDVNTAASTAVQTIITGQGMTSTIIDCNGDTTGDRCFEILDTNLTLSLNTLTLQDGERATSNGGGAIEMQTGSLVISQVKFSSHTAVNNAGAIEVMSSANSVTIDDSWFDSNTTTGGSANGGAVFVNGGVNVVITDSLFTGNTASNEGGALQFFNATGTLLLKNNTFYNNSAVVGGAVSVAASNGGTTVSTVLAIKFSTFADNIATTRGAGLSARGGGDDTATITVSGTILYHNTVSSSTDNCGTDSGTITSATYNIESSTSDCGFLSTGDQRSTNPGLASLADNGGSTQTMAFSDPSTSAAVDVIDAATCASLWGSSPLDQRGEERSGYCDVGAYEHQNTAPVITLAGSNPTTHECATTYTDAGATATDDIDGTLTPDINVTNNVNANVVGSYSVGYTVTDSYSESDNETRTVNVTDTTVPVITRNGEATITIEVGDTYTDASATVSDSCDGSITVSTAGTVDTTTAGSYTLTYSAQDDSGNSATEVTRTVTVEYGELSTVERSNNTVTLTYANGHTTTVTPFGSSKKFYVQMISAEDGTFVATNGKVVKLYQNLTKLDQLKIRSTVPQERSYFKLKTAELYDSYTTGMVVVAGRTSAKLTVFRVTAGNELKKKVSTTFDIDNRQRIRITTNASKHRIQVTVGQSPATTAQFRLTSSGTLRPL